MTVSPTLYPEDFEPDFAVEPPHPIFGAEPRALHSGQCGRAGRGVSLPYVAVLEEDKLARERIGKSNAVTHSSEVYRVIHRVIEEHLL